MSILDEIVKEIKTDDVDRQVREICDKIFEEEQEAIHDPGLAPKGPNVFLALQVPGRFKDETSFICLEREASKTYITSFWSGKITPENQSLKRIRVRAIRYDTTKHIMKEFATNVKHARGE